MNAEQQKVVQYLNEAHASERALVRVLQSQIAMTPRGSYRIGARDPPRRDARPRRARRDAPAGSSDQGGDPLRRVVGVAETVVGQALALGKTPFDLLRGSGGEEKVLKNAKDACATEALEIATYTAIERLAQRGRRRRRPPSWPRRSAPTRRRCSRASCARSRSSPTPSSAPTSRATRPTTSATTGAADAVREAGEAARRRRARPPPTPSGPRARPARCRASPGPRARSRAPSRPRSDLAIARYDTLTAEEITGRLAGALADRPGQDRRLRAQEPEPHHDPEPHHRRCAATSRGPGYDELTAAEVQAVLVRGRRRPHQRRPRLRARAQEPRRRPEGRRARAHQRLTAAQR